MPMRMADQKGDLRNNEIDASVPGSHAKPIPTSSSKFTQNGAQGPKMPAAFRLLNRTLQRPQRSEVQVIEELRPTPIRDLSQRGGLHRRQSSRSCDNIGLAFSSPAEARSLYRGQQTASREEDLASVLDLYHEGETNISEHEDSPVGDRNSIPSIGLCSNSPDPVSGSSQDVTEGVLTPEAKASIVSLHAGTADIPAVSSEGLRPDVTKRDRYGFRSDLRHIDVEAFRVWHLEYEERLERRKVKWDALLKESGIAPVEGLPVHFPSRSMKVQRYVRKGIPPEYRGLAWFHYANGARKIRENIGRYRELTKKAEKLDDLNNELIERDLHRTFPDNVNYKPDGYTKPPQTSRKVQADANEPSLIKSLRRVLQAFAVYRPRVGYCQSLNFIAGLFLLFLDEEKSFWMLVIVTTEYLPNVHDANLEGANIDQAVLMLAIKESLPAVWSKMAGSIDGSSSTEQPTLSDIVTKLPPITLVTAAWFMSAFTGVLPIETTLRVWDCFFYEGSKILFRIALTILKIGEPKIIAVNEFIEIFQVVQALPKDLIDPGFLMEACFKRRNGFGHLSQKDIDQRREKIARLRQKCMKNRLSRDDFVLAESKSGRSIFRW